MIWRTLSLKSVLKIFFVSFFTFFTQPIATNRPRELTKIKNNGSHSWLTMPTYTPDQLQTPTSQHGNHIVPRRHRFRLNQNIGDQFLKLIINPHSHNNDTMTHDDAVLHLHRGRSAAFREVSSLEPTSQPAPISTLTYFLFLKKSENDRHIQLHLIQESGSQCGNIYVYAQSKQIHH